MAQTRVIDVPTRLPLVSAMNNRETPDGILAVTKDARLVNAYLDKDLSTGDVWIVKRPGTLLITPVTATVLSGEGLGAYTASNGATYFFSLAAVNIRIYRKASSAAYIGAGWASVVDVVYCSEIRNASAEILVLASRAGELWTINTTTDAILEVTDADYAALNTVKGIAVLDGTCYAMTVDGAIYGSGINSVFTWDPLNVIQANTEGDVGVSIRRHLSYVIAFKKFSTQVFYDAGNAVGSPLSPVAGAFIPVGCADADSIQECTKDTLIWVAYDKKGRVTVGKLKGLTYTEISTPAVERLLNKDGSANSSTVTVIDGHIFYILRKNNSPYGTLAYDIELDQWYYWSDPAGNPWPYVAQCSFGTTNQLLQHRVTGLLYEFSTAYYNDTLDDSSQSVVAIPMDIYTPNFDAGVDRIKYLSMMRFNTDQVSGSMLKVRCNDSDFEATKWTNFRQVDLSVRRPVLSNCGSFYRRSYHLRHDLPTKFRIRAVDLQMELGTL